MVLVLVKPALADSYPVFPQVPGLAPAPSSGKSGPFLTNESLGY